MISKQIERIRKEKKISLQVLADEIGMSFAGLHKALTADDLRISQIQRIATALDVPISSFFNDFEPEVIEFFVSLKKFDKDNTTLNHYIQELYIDFVNNKFKPVANSAIKSISIEMIDDLIDFIEKGKVKPSKKNGIRSGSFFYYPNFSTENIGKYEFEETLDAIFNEFINYTSDNNLIKWLIDNKIILSSDLIKAFSWVQRKS